MGDKQNAITVASLAVRISVCLSVRLLQHRIPNIVIYRQFEFKLMLIILFIG